MNKKPIVLTFILMLIIIAVSIGLFIYFESELLQLIVLIVLILSVLSFAGYFYWHSFGKTNKLKEMLDHAELLFKEGSEEIKSFYLQIYHHYLTLPEKHKPNYYSKVVRLREKIANQLKTEKEIKELLDNHDSGNLRRRKEKYLKLQQHYHQLPEKVQGKYYHHLVHLKDQLERGK
ncbi:hypothetical protein HOA91_04740 [Candidatus Woesearchaeota archaeon]|jgi:hypothetical protein|nr:hypothetical protein [Candidatus Woesearchaeota archaeon]